MARMSIFMSCYENFAQLYDKLMDEVDYNEWANYLKRIIEEFNSDANHILDLACGTGNITIPMSTLGYNLWGVDISEEMLSIAENKARIFGQNIRFIKQDMRNLNLTKTFDVVTCGCDGVNYITREYELEKVFNDIFRILNPRGIFIFDISSFYKLKHVLGNNTFVEEKDGIFYCWENEFNIESSIVTMRLNFFVLDGKIYRRIEEIHNQKAYKTDEIYHMLSKSGFTNIEIFDEFTFSKPNDKSERIFFVAKKL